MIDGCIGLVGGVGRHQAASHFDDALQSLDAVRKIDER